MTIGTSLKSNFMPIVSVRQRHDDRAFLVLYFTKDFSVPLPPPIVCHEAARKHIQSAAAAQS